ncbi:MAG TPA: hypothetical protein VNZ50_02020 [Hyphomicrobiaceae bacterium]|nr:hypothetical protein [Hyphomicrobiaceae bacterium]
MDDIEGMSPRRIKMLLAAAAQLIKTDRGERTQKGKSGRQRIKQSQQIEPGGGKPEYDTGNRVDQAEKDDMGLHCQEVVEALRQRLPQVMDPYRANHRQLIRACEWHDHVVGGHLDLLMIGPGSRYDPRGGNARVPVEVARG